MRISFSEDEEEQEDEAKADVGNDESDFEGMVMKIQIKSNILQVYRWNLNSKPASKY